MKVILSRKGFDSVNGGIVSPILEDGTMISFPIPSTDANTYSELEYNGIPYPQLLHDLNYNEGKFGFHCHIDPDLDASRRKSKPADWFPAFGQINASASYLRNIGIAPGDIFLFFGNFHHVTRKPDGTYCHTRRTGDFYQDKDLQVIWGYLQVGEILSTAAQQETASWHPHSIPRRTNNRTNVIFKASEHLSFAPALPGAGVLPFDQKRVLTLPGAAKATWKYNPVYVPKNLLGCTRKNSAKAQTGIYYVGIWQELGLKESAACEEWCKSVIFGS